MKRDFQLLGLSIVLCALTACGKQKLSSDVFEKASDACAANILEKRFVVKRLDGSINVVESNSREEFIAGYLTENLDEIEYAEHDFRVRVSDVKPIAQSMFTSFADNWGAQRVNVSRLWGQSVRGQGVTVAVVDTGMDLDHPQLRKQVAVNTGEIGADANGQERSSNGLDDDGNGLVDDAGGFDFLQNRPLQGDYTGHGTHVAGIIAAAHNDVIAQATNYVQGMAPSAKILPLAFLDDSGSGSMLDGVRAIRYAVQRGAKVINASWGGAGCSRALRDTLAELRSHGVIFVSASGNDSLNVDRWPMYPASLDYPAQIVVGAVGEHDFMADYSNYGKNRVHLFAPGSEIVSTYLNGGMVALSGTSMATPFVAGAIALLLSAEPTAEVEKIRQVLYNTARKREEYLNASQGRMDLERALIELRR